MKYYFAYGSNMDQAQMKERCPESKLLCKAVLKEYKIDFTIFSPKRNCGCADIVKSMDSEVWGLLYEVSDADIGVLDVFEGYPIHYRRFKVIVFDDLQNEYSADTYEVVNKNSAFQRPSIHYLGLMQTAATDFAFPDEYKLLLSEIKVCD